ncbi:ABC transporter ATP-binding protein [Clostridium chauvoei]|uniref:ABC transporter ATP-binding protein n=2 Tax=Clostridium chauvoei TaxID=46867 RepID=A0ABD4RKC6_9CLOT|nr:ABC transporter ATP-binding protein [Clostridium chauvoei]ATD55152.1 ABC transporter [Clostridium chauvoei]ATD57175.1 ABC transporter [Clostridium chauvoei]MBX7281834.1 ABC transporter ATP-binding protein [Clostridium chauvoei]MBX7284356.1 ABC transporter ATP-binding protein [Clostridium chauvoei]MBX7286874.1 ABC transporter ATP-binding protein [Clostridium chauvoei]
MLEVNSLSLNLGDKLILDDINFTLKKSTILGLVGPSGVGKTSLIRTLVGIYEGTKGEVLLNGKSIYDNAEAKKKLAYVPDEHNSFYLITIKEIVNYYKSIYDNFDEHKFNEINRIFKIPIDKRFFQLSKGMKVRVNLMISLSLKSEFLVLDEPTSGLDPILKEKVLKLIMKEVSEEGKGVIISSHNLIELERLCDDIIMLDEGKIAYHNSLEGIKKNIKKIQVAFDMPVYKEDLSIIDGIFSISQIGRVFTIVTDKYNKDFKKHLNKFEPLFIEEIDLSLEEVFIHKLEKEDDYEKIFK